MWQQKADKIILEKLGIDVAPSANLTKWMKLLGQTPDTSPPVKIALVGKYVKLKDSYISIEEAIRHAAISQQYNCTIIKVNSEEITETNVNEIFKDINGIIVAPGFGSRGIEGKITTIHYARSQNIPFLGICLGLQCAVIEFARNVLGMKEANSVEFAPSTPYPVLDLMEDQKSITQMGGTMRLGSYKCKIKQGTLAFKIYRQELIEERHRHRYEVNPAFLPLFEKNGFIVSGVNPETGLVEIMEIPSHRFFIGVQFHPEFKSRFEYPHPLFIEFVKSAYQHALNNHKQEITVKENRTKIEEFSATSLKKS